MAVDRNTREESGERQQGVLGRFMEKYAVTCARLALGVIYVWFGALKLVGRSPAANLVEKTTPFLPRQYSVPMVGGLETLIGLGFLFRIALKATLVLFFGQIMSTFAVLVVRPKESFQQGNPLLPTQTGEFVIKNLALLAAGIAIGSTAGHDSEEIRSAGPQGAA